MISRVRFLIMPLVASTALWCSTSFSTTEELLSQDASELNLSDEGVADDFFGYWNTFGCALYPLIPYCVAGAYVPYWGPAWYNSGWGGGFGGGGGGGGGRGGHRHHRGSRSGGHNGRGR